MILSVLKSNAPLRRLFVTNIALLFGCSSFTFIIVSSISVGLMKIVVWSMLTLISAVLVGVVTLKLVKPLLVWHERLSTLDSETLDATSMVKSSGDNSADRGWNKLIENGRKWQAYSAVQREIDTSLSSSRYGDSTRLLDAIASAIAAVDAEGRITYANAMMAGICGADSTDQLIGQPLGQAMNISEAAQKALEDSQSCDAEWSVSDGTDNRLLRGHRRPINENLESSVWTIRDITQQRLAESMREKFLTAATHEFRTPLANIRAYAESLDMSQDIDAESRKHFYNVIQSESLRLSQLVDDLLDISRMQAGALALERSEVDLGRLVEDVAMKVQGQMASKSLQLRNEFPPKYPKFACDKNMIAAALVNLLGNAAKYTPENGKITFRVEVNARTVQFSVTDTGIGIAEDELPNVFDRFFRSEDERVQEISGSGLGLALVQEVARLHGGDVLVESVINQGSTFRLVIPLG